MSPAQRGGYIHLLALMWTTEDCTLRNNEAYLCRLSGLEPEDLRVVEGCFKVVGTNHELITHKRLREERSKQDVWREKSRLGGLASAESRAKGGSKMVEPKGNSSSSSSNKSFNKLKDKSPQKKEKVLKEFPEEVLELSKEFFLAVRSWLPEFQKKVGTDAQITNLLTSDTWALEISRAISIDMRTSEQIRFLLHYVHGGEVAGRNFPVHNFWSKNILSPKKLREKFDQLTADARSKLGGRKNSVAQL